MAPSFPKNFRRVSPVINSSSPSSNSSADREQKHNVPSQSSEKSTLTPPHYATLPLPRNKTPPHELSPGKNCVAADFLLRRYEEPSAVFDVTHPTIPRASNSNRSSSHTETLFINPTSPQTCHPDRS